MSDEDYRRIGQLIRSQRWGALATITPAGEPNASAVAFVAEPLFDGFLLHLSRLALHTRNLMEGRGASLLIGEADDGAREDPQLLARLTLSGQVVLVEKGSDDYGQAKQRYLTRLPASERLFDFPDFLLFRLVPREARFVGGFAQARSLDAAGLRRAATLIGEEEGADPLAATLG